MVVKDHKHLYELLNEGYIPYYHRRVKRWYLRKGSKRLLVDKCLEEMVKGTADEFREWVKAQEVHVEALREQARRLRAKGLTVDEVAEALGVSRSTLYKLL
ncbi:MAG: Hin recombinase [Desulfurococcales archaeon]|nr:Hin recombinase [Desulfurococcales archaeon]